MLSFFLPSVMFFAFGANNFPKYIIRKLFVQVIDINVQGNRAPEKFMIFTSLLNVS